MHALACEYAQLRTDDALDKATYGCLPLCALIARRFVGRGADYEDLFQVASMALVAALRGFDPSRGLRFATYVTPTITGTVRNYLRDKGAVIRSPRGLMDRAALLRKTRDDLIQHLRREPTVHELSDALFWSPEKVLDVLAAQENLNIASLDVPIQDGIMPADVIGMDESGFAAVEIRQDLKEAMKLLSNDERMLLMLRYSKKMSQRDAAAQLNLSQMQVSRMERRALATLRSHLT